MVHLVDAKLQYVDYKLAQVEGGFPQIWLHSNEIAKVCDT